MMLAAMSVSAAIHQFGGWIIALIVVVAIVLIVVALARMAGVEIPEGLIRMFWIFIGALAAILLILILLSFV